MQAVGIHVVYVGGYSTEAGLILRQGRNQGFEAQLVSGDALTNDEFWMITGPTGEGTLVTFGPDPRTNAAAAPAVRRFRDQGFEPLGYTLHTYAAVQAWAQAVEKAGVLDLDAVIKALRSHEFDTVLGKIGFDQKGDVTASAYVWYVWKDGKYVLAQ
jgi:branched-chain amino acid transport system substrate-binding protein